ncbi:ZIP family metal transporter [Candidatus Peregrinibacteria bacterium]|nr:ZIP family metal transporter [Candidatus Peregrinibacteria bacterium]
MTSIWYALLSTLLVSLISLIGVFLISMSKDRIKKIMTPLIAFATGAMFGGAFLHMIPEAYAHAEHDHSSGISMLIVTGVIVFFLTEKFLHWRHCHHLPDSSDHKHPVGPMTLFGDSIHNFTDGIIIAASYMISIPLGLAATLAVIMHEIPQEIGNFFTLLKAGYSRFKALFFNFLSALTAFLGVILVYSFGPQIETLPEYIVPITAGGFIYIAGSDLVPILHQENKTSDTFKQFSALLFGIIVMYFLKFGH